jgi:hypothetical protein
MPMLEKFGIYSAERTAELKKLSAIASEENRVKDRREFIRAYEDEFNVKNNLSTDFPGEIILNRFKINQENNSYLDSYFLDGKFSNTADTLIETSEIFNFGDNSERAKETTEIYAETAKAINELLLNSNEISSLSSEFLRKTIKYLKDNMNSDLFGYKIKSKMQVLIDALGMELERRKGYILEEQTPFDYKLGYITNPELQGLPEIISNYQVENSKGYQWDEGRFSCSALTVYSTRDLYNKNNNNLIIRNDNYFETCTDNAEKKLILNMFLTGVMNFQNAVKINELDFIDSEKFVSNGVYPKFAAQMIKYFPDSEVRFRGKSAKGDKKIIELLEIASKAGETVKVISNTKDLINNDRINREREEIKLGIEQMSRKRK